MTGNCAALQSLADEPGRVQINRADAQRLGIADQQLVWGSSRRGKVITRADISDRINEGAVYMTYQWWVGACNELTQDNLDPISKTPETKYCAVKVEAIADQRWAEQYAWTSYSEMKARLKAAVNVQNTAGRCAHLPTYPLLLPGAARNAPCPGYRFTAICGSVARTDAQHRLRDRSLTPTVSPPAPSTAPRRAGSAHR